MYDYYSCRYMHLQKCSILVMEDVIKLLYTRKQICFLFLL